MASMNDFSTVSCLETDCVNHGSRIVGPDDLRGWHCNLKHVHVEAGGKCGRYENKQAG